MDAFFFRGNIAWIGYYLRGKQFRESADTTDEKQAKKFLAKRMREVGCDLEGVRTFVTPQNARLTITDLVAALRAKLKLDGQLSPQNTSELKKLDADLGYFRAAQLTAEKIDAYKQEKLAEKYAPATVNRTLVFLLRCYSLAIERGHLVSKPRIELLPVSNARQGFFEDAGFRKLYACLPQDLKDLALFAFLTAWRKSEVSCLRWKYLESGVLRIPAEATKTGVARSVVVAGELAEVIERRKAARSFKKPDETTAVSEFIFHRAGERIIEFRKAWATACKKAGCAGRLFHDLRRSGVRNMIRSGVAQNIAMKISGHATTAMFRRYDICNEEHLKAAVESVTKYNADQSAKAAQQSNVVSMGGR